MLRVLGRGRVIAVDTSPAATGLPRCVAIQRTDRDGVAGILKWIMAAGHGRDSLLLLSLIGDRERIDAGGTGVDAMS